MNREILFRGKQVDSGEWVYGAFVPDALESTNGVDVLDGFIRRFNPDIKKMETLEVDRETVGQYIGEIDKNGTKIFEGDIVEFCGMRGKITKCFGAFGIVVDPYLDYEKLEKQATGRGLDACYCNRFISLWEYWWNCEQNMEPRYRTIEVIGNVWDNPELLDEKEESEE